MSTLPYVTAKSERVLSSPSNDSPTKASFARSRPLSSATSAMRVSSGLRSWSSGSPCTAIEPSLPLAAAPYAATIDSSELCSGMSPVPLLLGATATLRPASDTTTPLFPLTAAQRCILAVPRSAPLGHRISAAVGTMTN